MSEDSTTQCLLFPGIFRKPVVAQFDQREGSSDGGALLLKAADRRYGLVAGLATCLRDERQAGKVDHSLREFWWGNACSRSPAATRTPMTRLACPKIRFTNCFWIGIRSRVATWLRSRRHVSRTELGSRNSIVRGRFLAESVIRRHAQRLRHRAYRVTIDLDPTDDPTHGAQQLSFFNGHYDTWC